jgi:hypothetical protein
MHILMMAYLKPKRVNIAGFIPVKYKLYSTGKMAGLLPCCLQHNGMYHLKTGKQQISDRFQATDCTLWDPVISRPENACLQTFLWRFTRTITSITP